MRQRGLDPEHDLRLLYYSTDNNAILAAEQTGEAGAARRSVFERMPNEIRSQLRILGSTQSALSLIALANPKLAPAALQAVKLAFTQFPYSQQGLTFFQASHSQFVPVDAATMAKLDVYILGLKLRLEQQP